jgi:hypothetical protein
MAIEFNGQFDKQTFFKAVSLANRPSLRSRIFRYVVIGIAGLFLVINIFNFFARGGQNPNDILSLVLSIIILLYFIFGVRLTTYALASRLWKSESVRKQQAGTITEEGITYHPEPTVIEWKRFSRGHALEDMQLLMTEDGLLSIFPRSFFASDEDWKTFQGWVTTRLPQK